MTEAHLLAATIRISHALILAGATLHYGGHLGADGYTRALFEFVRRHPVSSDPRPKRVVNHIGWPLPLSIARRSEWKDVAEFKYYPRPDGLDEELDADFHEFFHEFPSIDDTKSALHRYAWARGMTQMREAQTRVVDARVLIGGPAAHTESKDGKKWYKSRIPGLFEEAWCSLESNQPVFLLGGFGGATRVLADEVRGKDREEMSWKLQREAPHAVEMRKRFEEDGDWKGYGKLRRQLRRGGVDGLRTGLTHSENEDLMETRDEDRIIDLLLRGLQSRRVGPR